MTKLKERLDAIKRYLAKPATKDDLFYTILVFIVIITFSFLLFMNLLLRALLEVL